MTYNWNEYQLAIFKEVKEGSGNVMVEADAGVGKSLTIEHSIPHISSLTSWIIVAFTKKVAATLKNRVEGDVYHLHSLGLKYLYRSFPKLQVNTNKLYELLEIKFPGKSTPDWELRSKLSEAVSLCKFNLAHTIEDIRKNVLDYYKLEFDLPAHLTPEQVLLDILNECKQDMKQVDQDDMIWFPIVLGDRVNLPTYDIVFVDEAQDLNKAQISMVLKLAGKTGRIFAFGSEKQALFGFCGADENAISNIIEATSAKVMHLPISYRCPKSVIREAVKIFPGIQPSENAAEGKVEYTSYSQMILNAQAGCFILSRVNAPLVGIALELLRKQKPCLILGRKFGQDLTSLIKKSRTKSVEKFLIWLEKWADKEVKKLIQKNKDTTDILDKAECCRVLCERAKNLAELESLIKELFEDKEDNEKIILSSIHRIKGLQSNNVFVLKWTLRAGKNEEEKRIKYVAVTRSAENLYYVDKPKE